MCIQSAPTPDTRCEPKYLSYGIETAREQQPRSFGKEGCAEQRIYSATVIYDVQKIKTQRQTEPTEIFDMLCTLYITAKANNICHYIYEVSK
jgi:hypothetical protein